ncbi:hypothetical protein IGB42_04148 [Andreprevotia sp. IGB-42]|uniref:toxin n=1 Tax=Andreprevotia sp. IGB-42 TaxID=2497473 RepID=UPI00135C76C1|nr:toxin [Andreprevotia sp. IGB-42]KAF0811382.1 hypothetical protein IGB42_04148 [Andreprevotia sp. IGB-42]
MRFVVVGTSGSGKSIFAAALARAADCPCIELDQLYWGPGWTAVPQEHFERSVLVATSGGRWVADGNYSAVRDVLWARATHIIWLNHGRRTVFSRILWRTISQGLMRKRLPHGNRESLRMAFFSSASVLRWSFTTFASNRIKFSALRQAPAFAHLQWIEITHPNQAADAIRRLGGKGIGPCG